jgi:hypothetical protein
LKRFEPRLPVFQQAVRKLKQFNRDEARLKEVGYSANESNYQWICKIRFKERFRYKGEPNGKKCGNDGQKLRPNHGHQ